MSYSSPEQEKIRYRTIPEVFFRRLYQNQKSTSKRRGHPPPSYTFDQLINWLKKQPHLTEMWEAYQLSSHARNKAPSLDRLNDNLPYTLDNIRLVTWQVNMIKSKIDHRDGKINQGHTRAKPVEQWSKDQSILIATFKSSYEAAEQTGAYASNIRGCCAGLLKSTFGFWWKLA